MNTRSVEYPNLGLHALLPSLGRWSALQERKNAMEEVYTLAALLEDEWRDLSSSTAIIDQTCAIICECRDFLEFVISSCEKVTLEVEEAKNYILELIDWTRKTKPKLLETQSYTDAVKRDVEVMRAVSAGEVTEENIAKLTNLTDATPIALRDAKLSIVYGLQLQAKKSGNTELSLQLRKLASRVANQIGGFSMNTPVIKELIAFLSEA